MFKMQSHSQSVRIKSGLMLTLTSNSENLPQFYFECTSFALHILLLLYICYVDDINFSLAKRDNCFAAKERCNQMNLIKNIWAKNDEHYITNEREANKISNQKERDKYSCFEHGPFNWKEANTNVFGQTFL